MKRILMSAAAAAVLLSAGHVFAQDESEMYVTRGEGDQWTIHGGTAGAEGSEVLKGENGAEPANCSEGSYWMTDQNMIRACGTDEEMGFAEIPEGQQTAEGEEYPENSYMVQEGGQPLSNVAE
jgi:hypothetical protein